MGVWDEFKAFIMKGDVVSLAVAVIIGLAFNAVVQGLVKDLITPLIGVFFKVNLSAATFPVNGSIFSYGDFLNLVISFVVIALVVFFLIVRPMAMMDARRKARQAAAPPTTRECPECLTMIPIKAKRCSACGSSVPPA